MNNREIAIQYLEYFCRGDIGDLESLLHEDLLFRGPLHVSSSRAAYLDSLRKDPPEKADYRLISITESEDAVSLYYDYLKQGVTLTIAQLFKFRNGRISEVLIIFNSRELA